MIASRRRNCDKEEGRDKQREADPIPFELYMILCKLAIKDGDIFAWACAITQWPCMASPACIDDLTFGQMSVGSDSIVIEFCNSKADQKGECTSPKSCYANPCDFLSVYLLHLVVFMLLSNETWKSEKGTILRNRETGSGEASHRYCNAIQKMNRKYKGIKEEYKV